MVVTPKKVADWFLIRASRDGEFLTQMKLQKLVYIAHGWHLALLGSPLIDEPVEAWKWGPVVRSLYREFSRFGAMPIDPAVAVVDPPTFAEPTESILEDVWRVYRKFTAAQLSSMTHREGTPWSQSYSTACYPACQVPNERIAEHYRELARSRAQ